LKREINMSSSVTKFRVPLVGAIALCFAVGMVGCKENEAKVNEGDAGKCPAGKQAKCTGETAKPVAKAPKSINQKPQKSKTVAKKATVKQSTANSKQTVKKQPVRSAKEPVRVEEKPVQQASVQGNTEDPVEKRRRETEDAVYALIRVKMEEALMKRKELLDAGTDPADPEVRRLEGQIMKARGYLIEAGEEVEPVDPPIVQNK
jgi:hypothetical protein